MKEKTWRLREGTARARRASATLLFSDKACGTNPKDTLYDVPSGIL